MAEVKKLGLDHPAPVADDEDVETLAAIDEGIRDAKAGRSVPIEEVRKRLLIWVQTALPNRQSI